MKGWAIKGPDGGIKTIYLTENEEWAWFIWVEENTRHSSKEWKDKGYTCVPVVIQEAGSGEAVKNGMAGRESGNQANASPASDDTEESSSSATLPNRLDASHSTPPASAGMVDAMVECGRILERYEHPQLRPLSEANFRMYDSARREIAMTKLAAAKGRP